MTDTLSIFRKVKKAPVVFLSKAAPVGWTTPTLLLRAMFQSKQEFLIVATHAAKDSLSALDLRRVYDVEIPGSCLRANKQGEKNGVTGEYEVHLRFPPKVTIAQQAWPIQVPYSLTNFRDINQLDAPAHVDLIGRVHTTGRYNGDGGLPKREAQLQSEEEVVTVEFLGDHSKTTFKKGDIVAMKGAKLDEYKGKRTIVTAYLTVVEINPTSNSSLRAPPELPSGSVVKKALQMKAGPPVSIGHVQDTMRQMEARANSEPSQTSSGDEEYRFSLVANVKEFDEAVFAAGAPYHGSQGRYACG